MKKKVFLLIIIVAISLAVLCAAFYQILSNSAPDISDVDELPNTDPAETDAAEPPAESECTHTFADTWSWSDGCHYRICTADGCDAITDKADCSGGEATCMQQALCSVCSYPYGTLAEHNWSAEWDHLTEDGHAHTCLTPDCTAYSTMESHIPGEPATEEAPQVCTECMYIITPVLEHVHNLVFTEEKAASCTEAGSIGYYTCSGCLKSYADAEALTIIQDLAETVLTPLGHTPGTDYTVDNNNHWCSCSVCGSALDKTAHAPASDLLSSNDEMHWYTCICNSKIQTEVHSDANRNGKCDICGHAVPVPEAETSQESSISKEGEVLEQILAPAQITLLRPVASGVRTETASSAIIDYSNTADGYVMVQYTEQISERLKVKVQGPTTTYTYNLTPKQWTVFPLSDGNGNYKVTVYKNVSGTRYATLLSHTFNVSLTDEFAPFLHPNQYVNYENANNSMQKAAELVAGIDDTLKKVEVIYDYVTSNISYDYDKAATVQSGYLPDLDQVLSSRKGICFDYAALMTGMLRSQNIACQLIVGYADNMYHAWINVWIPDKGWVASAIFFDGTKWQRMDPTFASTSGNSDFSNVSYTSKYIY